jgi:hypothetical protein
MRGSGFVVALAFSSVLGVQGSFTCTYELTGLNIANDTVLIPSIKNSREVTATHSAAGVLLWTSVRTETRFTLTATPQLILR